MQLTVRYEDITKELEVDAKGMWISLFPERINEDPDEELIRQKWEKEMNAPELNNFRRQTRHLDAWAYMRDREGGDFMDTYGVTDPDPLSLFSIAEEAIRTLFSSNKELTDFLICHLLYGEAIRDYARRCGVNPSQLYHWKRGPLKRLRAYLLDNDLVSIA